MVNTFVIVPAANGSFRESAKLLDSKRLWKQVVEAKQILDILEHLSLVASKLKLAPMPTVDESTSEQTIISYLNRTNWVKETRAVYLKQPIRYACIDGQDLELTEAPVRLYAADKFQINPDGTVLAWLLRSKTIPSCAVKVDSKSGYDLTAGKRCRSRDPYVFKRSSVILPGDTYVSLGFSQHAIVRMWNGYEEALRHYINDHLQESLARGINTQMKELETRDSFTVPWWTRFDNPVLESHRASLLRKDNSYYSKQFEQHQIMPSAESQKHGYIWTGNLSYEQNLDLLSKRPVDLKAVCAPVK